MRAFSWRTRRGIPGMPALVRPSFRDPRFALLAAGQAVNSIGGWASAIVLWGFAAYRFNASPYAVSVTIVCWTAPPALLSPLLGVYIDRIGPRAAVVTGYGGARALAGPAASAALALSGFPAAFIVDAASYLIGAVVLAPLPVRFLPLAGRSGWPRELAEGLGLAARGRAVRLVVLVSAAGAGTIAAGLVISRIRARLTGGPILMASVVGAVGLTTLQQAAPGHAHGRVMSVAATIQSWVETVAPPLGGVTLPALGVRTGALALAGIAVAAGLIGLATLAAHPAGSLADPASTSGE